jgi:anti-anti-sigma factor
VEFDNDKVGEYYIVAVTGRLNADTAAELEAQCEYWLGLEEMRVVLDLSGLDYISSAGLRSILIAAKKLKTAGGSISFYGLKGMVADVFRISGFAAMFEMYDTREQVLGS